MYLIGSDHRLFAIDAATRPPAVGLRVRAHDEAGPRRTRLPVDTVRGVALGHGHVYFGTDDNFVVARRCAHRQGGVAHARRRPREVRLLPCGPRPCVVNDLVVVGSRGGDNAHRGHLVGVRRQDREAALVVQRHSGSRREGQRDLGRRQLEVRRRRSLDDRLVRSGARPDLLGHQQHVVGLLRRPPQGRQSLHQQHRGAEAGDGRAGLALPDRPARRLGLRLGLRADARGPARRRKAAAAAHPAQQERVRVRPRPHERRVHLRRGSTPTPSRGPAASTRRACPRAGSSPR